MSATVEVRPYPTDASDEILGPTLARGRGGDPAILFKDRTITFDQLDAEANRFGFSPVSAEATGRCCCSRTAPTS